MPERTPDHTRESRQIIDRAAAESGGFADSLFVRAVGAVWPQPSPADDAAELWGRRIGRSLGVIAAILLIVDLLFRWFG